MGQHQHQECKVSRRHLRGRTDRRGYCGHHSAGYVRRLPRPRQTSEQPYRKRRRRREDHVRFRNRGYLHERGHRQIVGRRRKTLSGPVQAIARRHRKTCRGACVTLNRLAYKLPKELNGEVAASLEEWKNSNKVARLWQKDASLWSSSDEGRWLGWLTITETQLANLDTLKQLAAEVKKAKFKHVLLLGMGGSSLCPEVLRMTFGKIAGFPELHVLDSTDPVQIKALEKKLDLKKTLCIVSSKSGSTLEPNIFKQYFFERVKKAVGEKLVGSRFIAVTDPGSKMQQVPETDKFWKIFAGDPTIGGRYSALSNFRIVTGAAMGLDLGKFLKTTQEMGKACGANSAADSNPGVTLAAIISAAANHGRDKITIITSPGISHLGAWL